MDVVIEEVSSATRQMKFALSGDEVSNEVNQLTKKMTKSVSLPGFRKGKVPFDVVKRRFGDEIQNDAIMELVKERIKSEFEEREIKPLLNPTIENYKIDNKTGDYEITVIYEVLPEVDDPTLIGASIIKPVLNLSEDDIDSIIEQWKTSHMKYEEPDGPVEENDLVLSTIEAFSEGKSIWEEPQDVDLELSDKENEPMKIKAACVGKFTGDEFSVEAKYSEMQLLSESILSEQDINRLDSVSNIEYKIQIEGIQRPIPGELSESFLNYLEVTSIEDENFRSQAKLKIEQQFEIERDKLLRQQASLLLLKRNKFMPPESLVVSATVNYLESHGLEKEEIVNELEKGFNSENFKMAYLNCLADWKIKMIHDRIELDRDLVIEESEIESYIEEPVRDFLGDNDSEFFQQVAVRMRVSLSKEFRRNKITDAVIQDAELTETIMGLREFESWADNFGRFDTEGPKEDEVGELKTTDSAEKTAKEDSVSLIVDSTGTPIDKSKSD